MEGLFVGGASPAAAGRGRPILVSELDLEAVLQRVLDVARELTGARYAAIGVLDERRDASSDS